MEPSLAAAARGLDGDWRSSSAGGHNDGEEEEVVVVEEAESGESGDKDQHWENIKNSEARSGWLLLLKKKEQLLWLRKLKGGNGSTQLLRRAT